MLLHHEDFIARKDVHEKIDRIGFICRFIQRIFSLLETRTSFKHQESLHYNRRVIGVSSVKRTRTVVQMHAMRMKSLLKSKKIDERS